jgi:hypothetical protein
MILDRIAFYRYISKTSGVFFMVAEYMKGGEYPVLNAFNLNLLVKILKNHSNYMFGGELCQRNCLRS